MSEANRKVCCNCRHCLRIPDHDSPYPTTKNICEIDNHYLGYLETMTGWCRYWSKENKWQEVNKLG